jgi:hypothetical protein
MQQLAKLLFCSITVCIGMSGCNSRDHGATGPTASANGPAGTPAKSETGKSPSGGSKEVYRFVPRSERWPSLVQILAHPDHYHGKKLTVEGFLAAERHWTAIFLHRDDAYNMISSNGFWVSFKDNALGQTEQEIAKAYNNKYVLIEGTFDQTVSGGRGNFPGGFVRISRIGELGPPHLVKMPKSPEPKPGARDPFE